MAAPLRSPGAREALVALLAWMALDRFLGWLLPAAGVPTSGYLIIGAVRIVEIGIFGGYWRARGRTAADLGLTGPEAQHGIRAGLWWALALGAIVLAAEIASRILFGASVLKAVCGRPFHLDTLPRLLFAGALAGPVFEELLFRGVLYRGLREHLTTIPAVLLSAVVFASAHQNFAGIHPVQAAGGILFAATYERTGSLWTPLILHITGNAALFLAPYFLYR